MQGQGIRESPDSTGGYFREHGREFWMPSRGTKLLKWFYMQIYAEYRMEEENEYRKTMKRWF